MSDYTKSTNFASKDSLSSGNPLKIVKGTEIDTEFNNIATAVATKADLASPALTGTPTAPTASTGTNSTQLATTAFVQAALAAIYPIGSVYTNISDSTNPGTLLGFGTWVAITGKVVVGYDSGDTTFSTAGATGGSKDAVVVSHTHTATDSGHTHTFNINTSGSGSGDSTTSAYAGLQYASITRTPSTSSGTANITVSSTGTSATNANLQPYVVAYVWKRTA